MNRQTFSHILITIVCLFFLTSFSKKPELIAFNYENEPLVDVINFIAGKKEVNVVLPMGDNKIQEKFTWYLDRKVTIEEAWNLLQTILSIAGYKVSPQDDNNNSYIIVKKDIKSPKEITREPAPLYVGVPASTLPATDEQIRYLYYFANIKIDASEENNEVIGILKGIMPQDTEYKIDGQTNALLIIGNSLDIRSAMNIIMQLDQPGFQENMDYIRLRYADAQTVANLFNKQILAPDDANKYRLDAKKTSDASFFSKYVKILPFERTNSLIVLGRSQAIDRIRGFIEQYIDVKPESGESILHVYTLQYLPAKDFAKVLKDVIESKVSGGTEQSEGDKKKGTGPVRFFEGVIISTDDPGLKEEEQQAPSEVLGAPDVKLPPASYYGGNNLIIAARTDDWKRIKPLIEELDQPQPQVLIEVLIADLTLEDMRSLGSSLRNPASLPLPNKMNIQSGQVSPSAPAVIPNSFNDPQSIGVDGVNTADISRLFTLGPPPADANSTTENATSVEAQIAGSALGPGTAVLTINDNDGKTWNISQVLKQLTNSNILSHPHVISRDNQVAEIENTTIRVLPDQATASGSGAVTQQLKNIPATLKVKIRPRISIGDPSTNREGTVGLQIRIDINEFTSTSQTINTRTLRNVVTAAVVRSGDMLAIGGLIRTSDSDAISETPILSKIPIIGWLFKDKTKSKVQTNLTVFIMPTIIEPRLRGGIGEYTSDYLKITKYYAGGELFDSLKDPITRWFFGNGKTLTDDFADDFVKQDEIYTASQQTKSKTPTKKERRPKKPAPKEDPSTMALKKEQADQIREMIKDIKNPFENVQAASAA